MRNKLDETLVVLHNQLGDVADLEPEQIERLQGTLEEIQSILDQSDARQDEEASETDHVNKPDEGTDQGVSIMDQLRQATEQFEQSHPALTATIGRIADLLAQMGI